MARPADPQAVLDTIKDVHGDPLSGDWDKTYIKG